MSGPRRILYLSGQLPKRSETFVYREVLALRDRGYDISVASVREPERGLGDSTVEALAEESIPIYGSGPARLLRDGLLSALSSPLRASALFLGAVLDVWRASDAPVTRRPKILWQALAGLALARRVRGRGIQHIHAHMAHVPTTIAMYTARVLRVSFSFTGHAVDLFRQRTLLRQKLERASFVSCISHWHRDFYRDIVDLSASQLPVIRCGVDLPPERQGGRERGMLLAVGRLVPKKGFDLLLQAVAELSAENDITCEVVGEGPEWSPLEALRDDLELSNHVHFLGALPNDDVRALMSQAALFVLPCRVDSTGDRDGIPVVLMEAMVAGCCAIAGDLPAIRELIEHQKGGLLIASDDLSGLVEAIRSVVTDEALRASLAAGGRQRVVEEFSLAANIDRLEAAFQGAGAGSDRAVESLHAVRTDNEEAA